MPVTRGPVSTGGQKSTGGGIGESPSYLALNLRYNVVCGGAIGKEPGETGSNLRSFRLLRTILGWGNRVSKGDISHEGKGGIYKKKRKNASWTVEEIRLGKKSLRELLRKKLLRKMRCRQGTGMKKIEGKKMNGKKKTAGVRLKKHCHDPEPTKARASWRGREKGV